MSTENLYFRFFRASRVSAEREARRVCLDDRPGKVALLGLLGDELAGVASYELDPGGVTAEVAVAVADGVHRRGVATLLLEHLVSVARARGVQAFTAEVLADNYAVLRLLSDSGLALRRRLNHGVVDLSIPIPRLAALGEASAYLDAVAGRDLLADVASLEPLLAPRSVAVVGAGRYPRSAGQTILLNIRDAGFAGQLYAVSPHGIAIDGIRCVPSVAALPEAPDLAVVTVPPARVVQVAEEPVFGPVVVFGLGGIATGMLADHAARLAPLTGADADDLIRAIRAAPALLEHAPNAGALRDTLLRVSRLADDLPQVAELDLNPVIVRPDGVIAVDARIRVTSERLADPFLRQLPQ